MVEKSVIMIIPPEIAERLHISNGGRLFVSPTDKGIELTPFDSVFAAQMAAAEQVMDEDRDALRRLAEPSPSKS